MRRMNHLLAPGFAAFLLFTTTGSVASAQPDAPPPPPPHGDDAPPPPPPGLEGRRPRQPLTREEIRARVRQFLDQRAAQLRREQEDIERAVRMFDEGKTIEEIQAAFPDRPGRQGGNRRGGGGGWGGGGGIADWISRMQQGDLPGDGPGPGEPAGMPGGDRPGERVGGPPGQSERDPSQPLTSEERETIRDFISSTAPQLLGPLDELEKRDAALAEKKYRDMLRKTRFLLELRKRDRTMYDLRLADIKSGREAIESARAIARMQADGAATSSPEVERETAALRAAIESQFTTRTAIHRHELARGRDRLSDEEKDLASRESRREQIIAESMTKIVDAERRRLEGHPDQPGSEPRGQRPPRDDQGPPMRGPGGGGQRGPRSTDDPRPDNRPRRGGGGSDGPASGGDQD